MAKISTQLQNDLAFHLGELMHEEQNTHDWFEKNKIIAKINAVKELLDLSYDPFQNLKRARQLAYLHFKEAEKENPST